MDRLSDVVFDGRKLFIDNINRKQSTIKIITLYIEQILKDHELILALDDFMWYDNNTFDAIVQITTYFQNNNFLKFVFITTDEDMVNSNKCAEFLTEKVNAYKLQIAPWNNENYFSQILIP